MTPKFTTLLLGAASVVAAALSFGVTLPAQAQPYDTAQDDYGQVGGITVTAPRREHDPRTGAPIVNVQATRIVNVSDLDLSTGWGRHVMRERIDRAAYSACDELNRQWVRGLYPTADQNDVDCFHDAVDRALEQVPVAEDTAYQGY